MPVKLPRPLTDPAFACPLSSGPQHLWAQRKLEWPAGQRTGDDFLLASFGMNSQP